MSKGRRGRAGGGIGTIIIIIIFFNILKNVLAPLAMVAAIFAIGIGAVAIMAAIVAIIAKATRNSGYTEVKISNEKPSKNPYSVNYDKNKAEQVEAARQAAMKALHPDVKKQEVPVVEVKKEEPKHLKTGDAEIDKLIVQKDEAIARMKELDEAIEDEKLSAQIVHLEAVTEKIIQYIIKHPKKKKKVCKFFEYYLPTTIKLLDAYGRMDEAGISGTNIDGTKQKVEQMMDTALDAFDKQLDALYADEALDVSTDITVMQNMLKAEGLTEDDITLSL